MRRCAVGTCCTPYVQSRLLWGARDLSVQAKQSVQTIECWTHLACLALRLLRLLRRDVVQGCEQHLAPLALQLQVQVGRQVMCWI